MKTTIMLYKQMLLLSLALMLGSVLSAQVEKVESFRVDKDVLIDVNTSYTNVVFETWNKDRVEVIARVEGDGISKEELQEVLEGWDYEVLGNSEKIVVTSNAANEWFGLSSLEGLKGLKALEGLKGLEGLKELEGLKDLKSMQFDFSDMDFDFDFEVPDYEAMPRWPFSNTSPNIRKQKGYMNYHFSNNGNQTFDLGEYEEGKKAYVEKLNKRYGTNVKVKDVDRWLEEVKDWQKGFDQSMEEWGEKFGKQFEERFGADFEIKMERWGEQFGQEMEAWGEEFGEKFGKDMEKWGEEFGEQFGKDMEAWGEEFGEDMEKWAEEFAKQFEEEGANYSKEVRTDPNGNKIIILRGDKTGNLKEVSAKKTLIIKMPRNTRTNVNVRYGELKMADAHNLRATLNYSPFVADRIDGGQTFINAAYGPVTVNNWDQGRLHLKFIDKCVINQAGTIELQSSSSNVRVNKLLTAAAMAGSFGDIQINGVADNFDSIRLDLDNSDAFILLPDSAFNFDFNGLRSTVLYPGSMTLDQAKRDGRVLLTGYKDRKNNSRTFVIRAKYSNVKMQ